MARIRVVICCFSFVALVFTLVGCGGGTSKAEKEATGSLLRTFTLVDEQGRKAGTLTLNPLGGAELRDSDGRVIGTFAPGSKAPVAAEPDAVPEAGKDKKE